MGEAKQRQTEIETMKQQAAQMQQQQQQLAYMTQKEAVFVNGFFMSSVGPMVRLVLLESAAPGLQSHLRFAALLHAQDLAQLIKGASNLLEQMKNESDAASAPVGATDLVASDDADQAADSDDAELNMPADEAAAA